MLLWSLAPLAAGAAGLTLGAWLLSRRHATSFQLWTGTTLALAALAAWCEAVTLLVPLDTQPWSRLALSLELAHMVALLFLGATLIGRSGRSDPQARQRAYTGGVAALGLLPLVWVGEAFEQVVPDFPALTAGLAGKIAYVGLLLGLVVALAQLESVVRSSPEAQRYRLKYVLLGIATPGAYRIYAASQVLLFSVRWPFQAVVGGLVALVGVALVAVGLSRMREGGLAERVAVSPQMIYGSLTGLVVGLYLVGVGLFGQLLQASGKTIAIGLSELAVFLLSLALIVAVASRSARARFRQFVARHFLRSRYDYRARWLEVTDTFRDADSEDAVFDRLLQLLATTFGAGRVSIWARFEADARFHQVRSLNLEPAPEPLDEGHPIVARLSRDETPVELTELIGGAQGQSAERFVEETQAALGVPLASRGQLNGFLLLSRPPGGRDYDADDADLLRAIAHHVGVLLAQTRLAEQRRAGAELEALHRFSAFCLHDIKNLAARLSLVTQNARKHGDDPAFREAALDTVGRTAQELGGLMRKLRVGREAGPREDLVDLGALAAETLASLDPELAVAFSPAPDLPPVVGSRSELQQLLLNLLLNAREAARSEGATGGSGVRVTAVAEAEEVVLCVRDAGRGIPPERLRTLLRPFQTTKADGLGIGLYECRRIAEAHGGRLRVESRPGEGTRVEVRLPAHATSPAPAAVAASEEKVR